MTAQLSLPDRQVWTIDDLMWLPDDGLGPQAPVPDIVVVGPSAWECPGLYVAPPDVLLLVEVESPHTSRDRILKPHLYAAAGIPAYWRVELDGPGAPAIVMYVLEDGTYRDVGTVAAGEAVAVDVPFRVELRPAELAGPRRRS